MTPDHQFFAERIYSETKIVAPSRFPTNEVHSVFNSLADAPDHSESRDLQATAIQDVESLVVWALCHSIAALPNTSGCYHVRANSMSAAQQDLQEVTYALSHDLKSPADRIAMLLSEFCQSQGQIINADGRALLGLMQATLGDLQGLIADLMQYASLVADQPTAGLINLKETVQDLLANRRFAKSAAAHSLELGNLPSIIGDSGQIQLMLTCLIDNALKFHTPGTRPKVRIWCRQQRQQTLIQVADNGIGIAEADKDRIFRMFAKLHRTEDYPGHGLGLAMVRRVASHHEGEVTVKSEPGKGSTFTVSLPRSSL